MQIRIKKTLKSSLSIIVVLIIFLCVLLFFLNNQISSLLEAKEEEYIDTSELSEDSQIKENRFFISSEEGRLYKLKQNGLAGVLEFINKNPNFIPNKNKNLGILSLLPNNEKRQTNQFFSQDKKYSLVFKNQQTDGNTNTKHYYFKPTLSGYEIEGSHLQIHTRIINNNEEVYSLIGNLPPNSSDPIPEIKFNLKKAEEIALNYAKQEIKNDSLSLGVKTDPHNYLFNPKLVNIRGENHNYLIAKATVTDMLEFHQFAKQYYIDLTEGKIVHQKQLIFNMLEREIYEPFDIGMSVTERFKIARKENDPPTGDKEVDITFNTLGFIYNYFKQKYGRDSFDNLGSRIEAIVKGINSDYCPSNAYWSADGERIYICKDTALPDTICHEYGHALTDYINGFEYMFQSGSLSESISDIIGVLCRDDKKWELGNNMFDLTAIRRLDNPPATLRRDCDTFMPNSLGDCFGPLPDRLFSDYYECEDIPDADVHHNSTVFSKAFYLMSGNKVGEQMRFNNCRFTSISKEVAFPILYRALTIYLLNYSWTNFKDMYNAMNLACYDLHGKNSTICQSVKLAMQSVEIDQQPLEDSIGAICTDHARIPPCQPPKVTHMPN